ncbi:hypothetical protein O6H91_Y003500 [Diphasiastrum complanatum]|nr:hypothetical protein O6H91_Y003500 [Diphasiastrum complanatum]
MPSCCPSSFRGLLFSTRVMSYCIDSLSVHPLCYLVMFLRSYNFSLRPLCCGFYLFLCIAQPLLAFVQLLHLSHLFPASICRSTLLLSSYPACSPLCGYKLLA